MKIAYICTATGKYWRLVEELVKSFNKHFFVGHEVHFFIFSDYEGKTDKNVTVIPITAKKYPLDTLYRFKYINSIKEKFNGFDYLFYGNVNMKMVANCGTEILPTEADGFMVAVQHPGFYDAQPDSYTYERSAISLACIPYGKGDKYYQGCFFGGRTDYFLEMSRILEERITIDESRGHIAVWYDESHMNWYFLNVKKPKMLHPGYSFPELAPDRFPKFIIQINKDKFFAGEQYKRQS